MTQQATYWIGQNGQKYGPYGEADVRQWISEGRFGPDTLAWSAGMPAWVALAQLFPDTAARQAPPPIAPPPPAADFFAREPAEHVETRMHRRSDLPAPPSLHWGLVLLFNILSLGFFGLVWPFIQSGWVRKIDERSRATLLLGLGIGGFVFGYAMIIDGSGSPGGGAGLGLLLLFAGVVLYLVAYFSMAGSLEKHFDRGIPTVRMGGVTLFFFNMYYLQGQLRWLARWKETGRIEPAPPKAVFYLLWAFPFVFGVLAAIAIPAYQGYVLRAQVAEGMIMSHRVEAAVANYYARHGEMPQDGRDAGIEGGDGQSGRFVSSIEVASGNVVVSFDSPATSPALRDKVLVLEPQRDGQGRITWSCGGAGTTILPQYLPRSCRD